MCFRRLSALGAIASLLLLAGCGPTAAPEPTPIAVDTPTPTPTPTPTRPALDELVVTPEGIGGIVIGAPVPESTPESAIVEYDDDHCVWEEGETGVGDPWAGVWLAAYPDVAGAFGRVDVPFFVITADGMRDDDVVVVQVRGGVSTVTGVAVGDTRDAVLAAYPDGFDAQVEGGLSTVYIVAGSAGHLEIEVANDDAAYWDGAVAGTVIRMSVRPLGSEVFPLAGSDGGGPCPV